MNILEISDLRVYYETTKGIVKAVDGVDFLVEEGTSVGLAGESGCGKTTLGLAFLKLLPLNGRIESGSLLFEGENVYDLDEKNFRERVRWNQISMIFQGAMNALNPVFKVEDQIAEAIKLHDKNSRKSERTQKARDLLRKVDIDPSMGNHYPHEFSGGQRQRIGIARSLSVSPDIIVADEPVSALDVSIRAQILNLLDDLQNELGLTYIIVAHDHSVIRHVSDRVAVMYVGKLVEIAETNELYGHPMHPYTEALMSAVPIPDPKIRDERKRIILHGDAATPFNPKPGCRFKERCAYAKKKCEEEPPLEEKRPGHFAACWFPKQ